MGKWEVRVKDIIIKKFQKLLFKKRMLISGQGKLKLKLKKVYMKIYLKLTPSL